MNAGPEGCRNATVGFGYNDLASLEALLARHPGQVAAVFLEAATGTTSRSPGSSRDCGALADRDGFVLVFDEDHRSALGVGRRPGGLRRDPGPLDLG